MTDIGELSAYGLVIDERPYCFWSWDPKSESSAFLKAYDCDYFSHMANTFAPQLNNEEKHRAAVALRSSYYQGLESFFSLLFASLQAPHCIIGWLTKYRIEDIISIIQKVNNHQRIYTRFSDFLPSWENIVKLIIRISNEDAAYHTANTGFIRLWSGYARDFINPLHRAEYNSIKHGSRIRTGGFEIRIGFPSNSNADKLPQMQSLGKSDFGSTFYEPKSFPGSRTNYYLMQQSHNWSPENYVHGLTSISVSLKNLLYFLKIANNLDTERDHYWIDTDPDTYGLPWKEKPSLISSSFGYKIPVESLIPASNEQILGQYDASE